MFSLYAQHAKTAYQAGSSSVTISSSAAYGGRTTLMTTSKPPDSLLSIGAQMHLFYLRIFPTRNTKSVQLHYCSAYAVNTKKRRQSAA